ncbi:MAG TPA: hypothetical protein VFW75_06000 [Acetobacteraceae bacterium]|nr:hypothetical protein [Acetobacteraceae bacterium]
MNAPDTGSGPLSIDAVRRLNSDFWKGGFAAALKGQEHLTMIRLFATIEAQYQKIAYLEELMRQAITGGHE